MQVLLPLLALVPRKEVKHVAGHSSQNGLTEPLLAETQQNGQLNIADEEAGEEEGCLPQSQPSRSTGLSDSEDAEPQGTKP